MPKYVKILDSVDIFGGEYGVYCRNNGPNDADKLTVGMSIPGNDHIVKIGGRFEPARELAFQRSEFEFITKEEFGAAEVIDA